MLDHAERRWPPGMLPTQNSQITAMVLSKQ